jgi:hypothetical protein
LTTTAIGNMNSTQAAGFTSTQVQSMDNAQIAAYLAVS